MPKWVLTAMNIPLGPLKLSIQPFDRVGKKEWCSKSRQYVLMMFENVYEHIYGERFLPAGSYYRGPDDGDIEVSRLLLDEVLRQGFSERVCVRPLT